ncbi:MAG: response regulator transcription factor [Balneolaceae bacterium]
MHPKHTILLVEDEKESAEMLANFLKMHHYEVLTALDGDTALKYIENRAGEIHLAILDIMVPGADGMEICKAIREHPVISHIPVLFLTARDQEQDEIEGLELGADDYIAKPAGLQLIKARIETHLRRQDPKRSNWIGFGELYLDLEGKVLYHNKTPVDLTSMEYSIIELLMKHPHRVFSRQEILKHISDMQRYVFDRTVDVHIKNLRLKLEEAGSFIKTYRGMGYGMNRNIGEE